MTRRKFKECFERAIRFPSSCFYKTKTPGELNVNSGTIILETVSQEKKFIMIYSDRS